MASIKLTQTKISDTYAGVLHANGSSLPAVGQSIVYDGLGNTSAISIGRKGNGLSITGGLSSVGSITSTGGFISNSENITTGYSTGHGQDRYVSSNYGVIMQNDNSNFNILLTNYNSQLGSNNNFKPFSFSLGTGMVYLGGTVTGAQGAGVTINGPTQCNYAVTAPTFNSTSSIRFKENVKPIINALEIVQKLEGVTFDWKETGKSDTGLIAEEVNKVAPDFVLKDEQGEPLAIDYGRITSLLIEAIKELTILVQTK